MELLDGQAVTGFRGGGAWVSRMVDRVVGKELLTGRTTTNSVAIHSSGVCGKTRGLGSTSTAINIVWAML